MSAHVPRRRWLQLVSSLAAAAIIAEVVGIWLQIVGLSLGLFLVMASVIVFVGSRRRRRPRAARAGRVVSKPVPVAAAPEPTVTLDPTPVWKAMHEKTQPLRQIGGLYVSPHELADPLTMRMWGVLAQRPAPPDMDEIP